MSAGTNPKPYEFEFPGFPRRDDEHGADTWKYIERYNLHRTQYRPWERPAIEPPKEEPRLPYVDREPGEEG